MTLQRPLEMQAQSGDTAMPYAAIATRQGHDLTWATEGVVRLGLAVTQRAAGANMSVDVAAGGVVITGDDVAGQGKYEAVSDAVTNVTVPAAPASGTRIHRVIARIKDKLHSGSWTTYEWTIELLPDTGSGTPAVPASAIGLARVTVVAAQTSVLNANITDDRPSALLTGSLPTKIASAAARPPAPVEGEKVYRTDLHREEIYNGTTWLARHIARLSASAGTSGSARATNIKITLDTAGVDTANGLVAGSNRYVFPAIGWYRIGYGVEFGSFSGAGNSSFIEAWLAKNGTLATSPYGESSTEVGDNGVTVALQGSDMIPCTSLGDYVELYARWNSGTTGAAFSIVQRATNAMPYLTVEQIA